MPLYDLVIAPSDAAPHIASLDMPRAEYAGFACRPIDHVKLATLASTLGVGATMQVIAELEPIAWASEDGPWVSLVPAKLVLAVEALDPTSLQDVAGVWASSEEFKLDQLGPKDAENFLGALQKLIAMAGPDSLSLFLWSSL